jgi:hypothetical protein
MKRRGGPITSVLCRAPDTERLAKGGLSNQSGGSLRLDEGAARSAIVNAEG